MDKIEGFLKDLKVVDKVVVEICTNGKVFKEETIFRITPTCKIITTFTNWENLQGEKKIMSYYDNTRPEMLPFIPSDCKTFLDVGCANGFFGAELQNMMPWVTVHGVDPNWKCCDVARKNLDYVYCGDIYYDSLLKEYYDCIIFNDSLEHIEYPVEALNRAKELLTPNGYIVASIPNLRFYPVLADLVFNKNFEYTEQGVLDQTHFRFFTIKSIKNMFEKCGFEIIKLEGINKVDFGGKENQLSTALGVDMSDTVFLQFAIVSRMW